MIVFPNAKINIGLDIIARRPDGYHNIESVLYPVPWRDVLEIVPAKGTETTLTVSGRSVACPPEKNLVMKAYNALASEIELPPVDIYLRKVIPDGAGLGGGSADAAFTLTALNTMLSLGLPPERLAGIAAGIGADCPFFIYNRPMLATGTGTTLTPVQLSLAGLRIAIVKPSVSVPTAEAYAGVNPAQPRKRLADLLAGTAPQSWGDAVKNDFEPGIFARHPIVASIKHTLYNIGAIYAAMSGSGSAVFGIFPGGYANLADSLRSVMPQHDIFTSSLE